MAIDTHTPVRTTPSAFRVSFGPGLLWAAAAIGVSHLVQSTRAGADAGFALGGVILLALVLKYPFFEYGPRYAAATGESLIEGYRRIGRWAVWLYLVITLSTALIIQSARTPCMPSTSSSASDVRSRRPPCGPRPTATAVS
jgi:Mn2+/Fe2+ NRAMP family transporter